MAVGLLLVVPVANAGAAQSGWGHDRSGSVRLNQIQVIGTQNSFHQEPPAAEKTLRMQLTGPEVEQTIEYTHAPVATQLGDQKVRQVEFDVYADPDGGKYATPYLRVATNGGPMDPVMMQPGSKVLHLQDVDYHSSCLTLVRCLQQVKSWSDQHPAHIAIMIMLEFQDRPLIVPGETEPRPGTVIPLQWTRARMLSLEQEILSVFPRNRLLTPDNVRKPDKTLEQSVLQDGWPTVDGTRGKIMFTMDNNGTYRDSYLQGNPNLEGRLLFTNSSPGNTDAAFMKRYVWDPNGAAEITELVQDGYLVRTRADADTMQARNNDVSTRDTALATGAQWVSTDYPVPGIASRFDGSPYYAAIPGGVVARCNPQVAPWWCDCVTLE
ncbi:phosphatidylinositol-specific phospholipase C1-like protein [Actinophytocola sp.]|uniref:phosphatidylinositol-specific phospholipase C1-like protein n=1 Tax=Actinophytocola sp. TaxID=1872138 RepID=UPI0025C0D1FF|nr:phosphatidylinositol-specific phospholipase C1-like protein [Actinophytocola sp.]